MSRNSDLLRNEEENPTAGPLPTLKQVSMEQTLDRCGVIWREENVVAIPAYNEHIEKYGTFSDSVQKF